jgi:hypothetical protein
MMDVMIGVDPHKGSHTARPWPVEWWESEWVRCDRRRGCCSLAGEQFVAVGVLLSGVSVAYGGE